MGQAKAKEVEQSFGSWEKSQRDPSQKSVGESSRPRDLSWLPQAILSGIGITSLALLFSWIQEHLPGAYLSSSSYYLVGLLLASLARLFLPLERSRLFRAALPCLLMFGLLPLAWSLKLFTLEPVVTSFFSLVIGFFLVSSLSFPVGGGVAYILSLLVAIIASLPIVFRLYSFSGIQGLTIVSSLSLFFLCLFKVKAVSYRALSAFGFSLFSSLSLFLITLFSSQSIDFLNKDGSLAIGQENMVDLNFLPDLQGRTLFVWEHGFKSEAIEDFNNDHVVLFPKSGSGRNGLINHFETYQASYQRIVLGSLDHRQFSSELLELYSLNIGEQGELWAFLSDRPEDRELSQGALFSLRTRFSELRIFRSSQKGQLLIWASNSPDLKNDLANSASIVFLGREIWALPVEILPGAELSLFKPLASKVSQNQSWSSKIESSRKWFYRLYAAKRSLLALKFADDSLEKVIPILPSLIKDSCGGKRIELKEPDWRSNRTLCRDSVVAAMVAKKIKVPQAMAKDIHWAQAFVIGESVSGDFEWQRELANFAMFDSVFLKLSAETLLERLRPCLKGISEGASACRKQLARTLSMTAHHELAQQVLLADGGEELELEDYLKRNKRIFDSR